MAIVYFSTIFPNTAGQTDGIHRHLWIEQRTLNHSLTYGDYTAGTSSLTVRQKIHYTHRRTFSVLSRGNCVELLIETIRGGAHWKNSVITCYRE